MIKIKEEHGHILLRWSLGLLFLIFGIMQVYSPIQWTSFVPSFFVSPSIIVLLNGSMEIFLGLLLLFGLYTRIAAIILALHLIGISFSIGFSPLGLRDIILGLATLSLAFFKPDKYSLDFLKTK